MPRTEQAVRVEAGRYIRRRGIPRGACGRCGGDRHIQAHHPDYTRTYEVIWLCAACHVAHHRAGLDVSDLPIVDLRALAGETADGVGYRRAWVARGRRLRESFG